MAIVIPGKRQKTVNGETSQGPASPFSPISPPAPQEAHWVSSGIDDGIIIKNLEQLLVEATPLGPAGLAPR